MRSSVSPNEVTIPDDVVAKWQEAVDILAEVVRVPAALIMRVDPPFIEVFRASRSKGNPYRVGHREHLAGLYCERVIKTKAKLLVPNALKDPEWDKNPDIRLGMIAYLGFPLLWPGGEIFGTICVLDVKENPFSETYERLLLRFKELVEAHLALAYRAYERERVVVQWERVEQALERKMEQLAALIQASQAITASLELDQVLAEIVSLAGRVVAADYTSVVLIDGEGRLGRSAENLPGVPAIRYRIRSQGLTSWVARTRQPVIVDEIDADGRIRSELPAGAPQTVNPLLAKAGIRSLAGLPLVVKDHLLGVLYLHSLRPGAFSDQRSVLVALANQAAIAIENARLHERAQAEIAERKRAEEALRQRAMHLETLNAIIATAAAAKDLRTLLEIILDYTLRALGLEMGAIWVGGQYVVRGVPPEVGRVSSRVSRSLGLDLSGPIVVDDLESDTLPEPYRRPAREAAARFGIRAILTAPILAEEQRIGGLSLASARPRSWTKEEVALVEAVGRQLGATVERLRLLEEVQAHVKRMQRLAVLGTSMNRPLTMQEVIAVIGEGAQTLSGADRVAVYTRGSGESILCPWSRGLSREYITRALARTREMPGAKLLEDTRPIMIPDVHLLPKTAPVRTLAEAEGFRAVALWPLVYEGRAIAAVGCYFDAPRTWSEGEREVMEAFVRQAAVALESARLYTSLQEMNQELQEALQAKDEMIQNVSHELRTPLTLIQGYVELLAQETLGSLSAEQQDAVRILDRESSRLRFMVERLLMLQTLDPESFRMIRLEPAPWLRQVARSWQRRAEISGIQLALELAPDLPDFQGDPDMLGQVIDNLLDNAFKFSPEGGRVSISAWHDAGEVVIAISDQGVGIPPDKLERIFERFYQVDGGPTRRFRGMGIGLALCHEIVRGHGGRIWAKSAGEGRGSTFYIALPAAEA